MAYKFNVKKELSHSGTYSQMPQDALAFHDALNRSFYVDFRDHKCGYFYYPLEEHPTMLRSANTSLRIGIPFSTGKIICHAENQYTKKDKILISRKTLDELLQYAADFVGVCAEHGLLIFEKEANE